MVRTTSGGPVRISNQYQTTQVFHQVRDPGGRRDQCPQEQVASGSPVCLPSSSAASSGSQKDTGGGGGGGGHTFGSLLAQAPLVCGSGESLIHPTMENPSSHGVSTPRRNNPPRASVVPSDRLEVQRSALRRQNISDRAIHTILAARRPSTNCIYQATWNILDFSQEGLDKGLSTNTLCRQVAALSSVLYIHGKGSLSQNQTIRRFLKGAANLRPPMVHRFPTWDLPKVLRALMTEPFEPLRSISLHLLSLKVAFLVAITSARRISEMSALSVREDLCVFHPDRVVLRLDPSFIPKINSRFHRAQELILPNFCPNPTHNLERAWHTLDVHRALKIYMWRTHSIRKSEALFVSFQPGTMGLKVSPSTVGRWIRACIAKAYQSRSLPMPRGVMAHSTRSAATMATWATQAPIEEICRAATWSSPSPFIWHYRLAAFASVDAAFNRRVLQSVHGHQCE
ncbi:uncharacterized protein LOC113426991 [Notechis scutatus]|uniref:Uncharacterized protein LOC113426991 n=1 Tax=Notechis scutatus TaxID=8663 RepID=A0A6J1VZ00_9SAUR|nr:uncharacterized protein LOC113426991 [Notechis scutatus]